MHPDLERERFIDHIQRLQQELARLRMEPSRREMGQIERLKERCDRLASDNAVLRARMSGRAMRTLSSGQAVPIASGEGCRVPNGGLGTLTHAEVAALHVRQLDSAAIAAAAGVHHSSLSRWRKANSYVLVWAKRACGSPAQQDIQGQGVVADGRDDGQAPPVVPIGHCRP